jgi:hypothetical protein
MQGLLVALHYGHWLSFDSSAPQIELIPLKRSGGCGIIEAEHSAMTVMAINYAHAVKADVVLVKPLEAKEDRMILLSLKEWQEGEAANSYIDNMVTMRLIGIAPSVYDYVIFFTSGLPYSLVIKNQVPCCYVHLKYRPDQFLFWNIFLASKYIISSGIVFSPQCFVREEINFVEQLLHDQGYYVRQLTGENATMLNFNMSAKHFPFSLLHICSHGGEVSGVKFEIEFTDSRGINHTVEYDQVLSSTPPNTVLSEREVEIEAHNMVFPRKIDGREEGS